MRHDRLVVLSDDAVKYYSKFSYNKNIVRVYNGRDILIDYGLIEDWYAFEINKLKASVDFYWGRIASLPPLRASIS